MYDKNASGSIDVNEFQQLFSAINQWKAVFQGYDKDKSGSIEQSELTQGNAYVIYPSALVWWQISSRIAFKNMCIIRDCISGKTVEQGSS